MKIQLSVILFAFLLFGSDYVYGQKLTSDPYADQIYGGYKNGIVGATSGQASVTISGAAQYEIPLDIPKGIGGLTPELTISYNSSNRDGIIGWGFTLEGLSQISRTVTPLLHTNTSYPISLTDDDYYALDGNILNMRIYGSYGKCYFLRYEDTTLFKSDETYSKFVGQSGNGSTVTYGGTANSRVYAQGSYSNKVLLWLLNEVCDKNGNYYTITYQQNEGGEAYPDRIFIYAGDECIAINSYGDNRETAYLHNDVLGTPIAYSDATGHLISAHSYDAWGRRRNPYSWDSNTDSPSLEITDRYGFTGHEHIDLAEVVNMNGRVYDPVLGRFISPDPYVQDSELPANFNRYTYCLNNPLRYTDPTGEFFIISALSGLWKSIFTGNINHLWNNISNAYKIEKNMFTTNKLKNFWGRSWELISRFTWQLPQTSLGKIVAHGYNSFSHVKKVSHAYGALVVVTSGMDDGKAVTLGHIITGGVNLKADVGNYLFRHEYGHYLQSQRFGWKYIPTIGIPSLISASSKGKMPNGLSRHKYRWFEMDANQHSFHYFEKHIEGFDKSNWDNDYPLTKRWRLLDHSIRTSPLYNHNQNSSTMMNGLNIDISF